VDEDEEEEEEEDDQEDEDSLPAKRVKMKKGCEAVDSGEYLLCYHHVGR
jgi:hypothetical protein